MNVSDCKEILDCAYAVREEAPELFMMLLEEQFVEDGWHESGFLADGHPVVHASQLSKCLRAQMYHLENVPKEATRPDSNFTFDVGKFVHCLFQLGLAAHPRYTLVGHEYGGVTNSGLAARADAVYFDERGKLILIDIKTERPGADKGRNFDAAKKEALERGVATPAFGAKPSKGRSTARSEHATQLQATSKVLLELHGLLVDEAWAVYVDRGYLDLDPQPVTLETDQIESRVNEIQQSFRELPVLPARLADDHWNCKAAADGSGLYCPYRGVCRDAQYRL